MKIEFELKLEIGDCLMDSKTGEEYEVIGYHLDYDSEGKIIKTKKGNVVYPNPTIFYYAVCKSNCKRMTIEESRLDEYVIERK